MPRLTHHSRSSTARRGMYVLVGVAAFWLPLYLVLAPTGSSSPISSSRRPPPSRWCSPCVQCSLEASPIGGSGPGSAFIAFFFTGELLWLVFELVGAEPTPSPADACFVAAMLLMIVAILRGPGAGSWPRSARSLLDAAVLAAAVLSLGFALVVAPNAAGGVNAAIALALAYNALGVLALVPALALVLGSRRAPLPVALVAAALQTRSSATGSTPGSPRTTPTSPGMPWTCCGSRLCAVRACRPHVAAPPAARRRGARHDRPRPGARRHARGCRNADRVLARARPRDLDRRRACVCGRSDAAPLPPDGTGEPRDSRPAEGRDRRARVPGRHRLAHRAPQPRGRGQRAATARAFTGRARARARRPFAELRRARCDDRRRPPGACPRSPGGHHAGALGRLGVRPARP